MTRPDRVTDTAADRIDPSQLQQFRDRPLSIPEQIAVQLAREILNGDLKTGQKLSEYKLAERFGTSRGPIRSAIDILERNSLVRSSPRLSARVNSVARSEVEQLFSVRGKVLGLLATYAARNATPAEIDHLEELVETLAARFRARPEDINGFYRSGHECWSALVKGAHARTLSHINSMIAGSPIWQFALLERIQQTEGGFLGDQMVGCWIQVVTALRKNDSDAAEAAAMSITAATWKMISRTFSDEATGAGD